MALPGKGPITNPRSWQDLAGNVPPLVYQNVPLNANNPLNGDGRYWWQGNAGQLQPNGFVTLLTHLNGANGAVASVDSSLLVNPLTFMGSAALSTTQKKYGTTSLAILPGQASYSKTTDPATIVGVTTPITVNSTNDVTKNNEDFTIEGFFWISTLNTGTPLIVFDYGNLTYSDAHNGFYLGVTATSALVTNNLSGWAAVGSSNGGAISLGAWHHFAVVRSNKLVKLYIDGAVYGSTQIWDKIAAQQNPGMLTLGCTPAISGGLGTGYIDEVRVTQGFARYTAPFAPPTNEFPVQLTNQITFIGDPATLTGTATLTWQLNKLSSDNSTVQIIYTIDGGVTATAVNLPNALQGLQSGTIVIPLAGGTNFQVGVYYAGIPIAGATNSIVAIAITRNSNEPIPWDTPNPFDPISYNCDKLDFSGYPSQTLAQLRQRLLIRLGFATQAASPPPGMALFCNELLFGAQNYIYRRYSALHTRRFFRWKLIPGQRFYSLKDNDDDVLSNFHLDPLKTIEWVGIQDMRNEWYPLTEGIPPQLYTMINKPWRPARYDIRQGIEVYPAPDQTYFLWVRANFGLLQFQGDTDQTTIDSELVFLHALANGKAHYGHADWQSVAQQANAYRGELIAGTHKTAHYIPGAVAVPNAVRPTLIQFQG